MHKNCKTLQEKLIDDNIVSISLEAIQQMSLDILFCMGQVASSSSYLTSSMKMNLETVMGETWQLVDLFIEWDWETYFTEHGQEDSKYNLGKTNWQFENMVISWQKLELIKWGSLPVGHLVRIPYGDHDHREDAPLCRM